MDFNNEDDEPSPEVLSTDLIQTNKQKQNQIISSNTAFQYNQSNKDEIAHHPPSSKHSITQENKCKSKEPSVINQSFNISKINTVSGIPPSKFENFDVQQLTYTINKDYSQLRINKDEEFMERMKFDIYKRQIKEDRVNQLVEQNKLKIDEKERIKAFNRLIGDANRRIEAQENLDKMKEKLEEDILSEVPKKYKDDEWNEIYNERFAKFKEENNKKIEERCKEKQEQERIREEEEANLCKVKKAPKKEIDKTTKRLYEESIKRKLKMEAKMSKVNYEQSPSKYKKQIKSDTYNFSSDNEDNNYTYPSHSQNQYQDKKMTYQSHNDRNDYKRVNYQSDKKSTKQAVSEFNNKRFEVSNNQNNKPQSYQNAKRDNHQPIMGNNKQQQNYLEQYLDDEDIIMEIPKPMNNDISIHSTPIKIQGEYSKVDDVKRQFNSLNNNDNPTTNNSKGNILSMKEKDANKIVDQFFTRKYKNA